MNTESILFQYHINTQWKAMTNASGIVVMRCGPSENGLPLCYKIDMCPSKQNPRWTIPRTRTHIHEKKKLKNNDKENQQKQQINKQNMSSKIMKCTIEKVECTKWYTQQLRLIQTGQQTFKSPLNSLISHCVSSYPLSPTCSLSLFLYILSFSCVFMLQSSLK